MLVGRIVGRWIIGFVEGSKEVFFGQDGWRFLTCMIEWLTSFTNLLFVNECWRGRGRTTASKPLARLSQGMEMQMRETEIPKIKNQADA